MRFLTRSVRTTLDSPHGIEPDKMKKYRIAVLGLTHDHVWSNLHELSQMENAEIVGAADPNAPLLQRVSGDYGCPIFENFEAMLVETAPEAVYVFGNNREGAELAAMAARRGLHVLIEKPMAADLAGAENLLAAAKENNVRLMVNWPFAWWPQLQKAIAMAKAGDVGRVWQVKYRAAHEGPREIGCSSYFCDWLYDESLNGAGAMMDYCCYGAVLACVVLGRPVSVTGLKGLLCKKDMGVDDNAMLAMSYPDAIATTEGSWTQIGKLTAYTTAIYGEEGTLLVEPRELGSLSHATKENPVGVPVAVPEPEPHLRSASAHFLWALETGEPFTALCEAETGRNGQAILEAGLKSCAEGRTVGMKEIRPVFGRYD